MIDVHLRTLERQMAAGDPIARARLMQERLRTAQCRDPRRDPRAGDRLRTQTGRVLTVIKVWPLLLGERIVVVPLRRNGSFADGAPYTEEHDPGAWVYSVIRSMHGTVFRAWRPIEGQAPPCYGEIGRFRLHSAKQLPLTVPSDLSNVKQVPIELRSVEFDEPGRKRFLRMLLTSWWRRSRGGEVLEFGH